MKTMTNTEFNEQARKALAMADKHEQGGLSSAIYKDDNLVRLYDGNGEYIYDFYVNQGKITYKLETDYEMEELTKKMAKRFIKRDNVFILVVGAMIVAVVAAGVFSSYKNTNSQSSKDSAKQNVAADAKKQQDTTKTYMFSDTLQKVK